MITAILLTNVTGGGTLRHTKELLKYWGVQSKKVLFINVAGRVTEITVFADEKKLVSYCIFDNIKLVVKILQHHHVNFLHVEHTLDAVPEYLHLHQLMHIPFVVTLHDYYTVCPFVQLTYEDHNYCGEKGESDCNKCLARRKPYSPTLSKVVTDIHEWRNLWYQYLKEASLVIVPSTDEKERLLRYFPALRIEVKENPEMINPCLANENDAASLHMNHKEVREVGLIGSLSVAKGAQKIKDVLSYLAKRPETKIHFTLFGTLQEVYLTQEEEQYITILGPYQEEQVYGQICSQQIDVFWFPAVWPETYSYTLSIPIRLGIPCLGTNLGAINSRIHEHNWGDTYPWNAEPAEIVQKILNFPFEKIKKENFIIKNTSFGTLESYYDGLIPSANTQAEGENKDQENLNILDVFSTIKGTLANNEILMLWRNVSAIKKLRLLRHVDINSLRAVVQDKGWKYFFKTIERKIFKLKIE